MPLRFPSTVVNQTPGSQGGFSALADRYEQNKTQNQVMRAKKFLMTGEDEDTRSYLQKAADKAKGTDHDPMTPQKALSTLQLYEPETYALIEKQRMLRDKLSRELAEKVGPLVYRGVKKLLSVPEEQRQEMAVPLLEELENNGADVSKFDVNQDGVYSDEELKPLLEATSIYSDEEGFTLSSGQARYDTEGNLIVQNEKDEPVEYKEFKEGDEIVTYEMNPDGTKGPEASRSPRFSDRTVSITQTSPEGSSTTVRMGGREANVPSSTGAIDDKEQRDARATLRDSYAALESGSNILKMAEDTPGAVGLKGAIAEKAGILSNIPVIGNQIERTVTEIVADASPEEITELRSELRRQVGDQLAAITGEESGRFTEQERAMAEDTLRGLPLDASIDQIMSAQKVAMRAQLMRSVRAQEDLGLPPPFDPQNDGSINEYGENLVDLGFSEEEAVDIISRLMRRSENPLLGGQ